MDAVQKAEDLWCVLARRSSEVWDFIDKRDIDKHTVSIFIMGGTWRLTEWALEFASLSPRPGIEIAAIVGAVTGPYMLLQAAAIAFYFKARQ